MPHALIIDDDLNNLVVLQEMLTYQGISYTSIQNPLQVESVLETLDQIDLVFLDLEMPNLDGYQIFDLLHSYPLLEKVPIVACTVHVGELHQAREMGFHSFISKPLNIHRFPDQLHSILAGTSIWDVR